MADYFIRTVITTAIPQQDAEWQFDDTDEDEQVCNVIIYLDEGDTVAIETNFPAAGGIIVPSYKLVRISDEFPGGS